MVKQSFKKAGLLLILYTCIIIGIFILQFRNESLISNVTGLLRMSVSQSQNENGDTVLKNEFRVSFNGISFSADDSNPIVLGMADKTEHNLTLLSWEQASPLVYSFTFTDGVQLNFSITDPSDKASLSITSHLPENAVTLALNYKPASGYSVTDQSTTKQTVSSKNISYKMNAPVISDRQILLTRESAVAMYNYYDESETFSFAALAQNASAAQEYADAVADLRRRLVSVTEESWRDSSLLTETAVSAYIAEMTAQGRFDVAVANVPDSFKKGNKRTYFTAPYLGGLAQTNPSLVMANENMASMISNAISQKTLDIFAVTNIADFMMRESSQQNVKLLAALPASLEAFQPTLGQATDIIASYVRFAKAGSQLADSLSPVIGLCLDAIAQCCKLNSNMLVLSEKDIPASLMQSIETGKALCNYGEYTNDPEYTNAGKIIIATAFDQQPLLDLRTLVELYQILVPDNPNFPHTQLLGRYHNESVWAWTVATSLTYSEDASGTEANIVIDFPQGSSHYIILNGIHPFSEIDIYGVPFRSDPRFEAYNSSGYVYNERTHTLFLKSRQKSQKETVRLVFK